MKKLLAMLVEKVNKDPQRLANMSVVVVGLPNVGKSSIINALRNVGVQKGKVSEVAPFAGVTRAIQTKVKINNDPNIYLVDTPGVLNPKVKSPIQGLRIALAGCTKDALSNELSVMEYLLFRLNQSPASVARYSKVLGLEEAKRVDSVHELLEAVMRVSKLRRDGDESLVLHRALRGVHSLQSASVAFISLFRNGAFGKVTLDDCTDEGMNMWFVDHEGTAMATKRVDLQREAGRGRIVYVAPADKVVP
ncbi:UNVERIFIED_CONTAM: hypothetical protein HDU68_001458 [Siphonaria sp. JEL0065]|nr:hypothetical protein HDU68_001458 [Siphonaria sp. JEL0065]